MGAGRTPSSKLNITLKIPSDSFCLEIKKPRCFLGVLENQPCVGKLEFPLEVSFQSLGIAKAQTKLSLRQAGLVPTQSLARGALAAPRMSQICWKMAK